MAFLNPVDTIATKKIFPEVVDGVFRNDPLLAFFKKNSLRPYAGGPSWQENIMHNILKGDKYNVGDSFDITQRQIATGLTFTPVRYYVNVSAYLEKIKVEMAGPQAVFDYVDLLAQDAALTMSGKLACALYSHGQSATADRTGHLNGLAEILSDGSNAGWTGDAFAAYGTVTRTDVNGALDSLMTGPTANQAGAAIDYPKLEQAYNSVCIGPEHPDLIVATNNGLSNIKMAFQSQQRFEGTDADFGFQGIKFNGAVILQSQYAPGTRTATSVDTELGYTATASGETLWFLNTKYFRFYVATDDLFGFGFTGFKPAQDNNTVAGQYFYMGNATCPAPRFSRYLFNVA
jgi:hypothetical protein